MANIGVSSVKIRDEDGDVAAVTSNALHVTMTDSDRGVGSAILSYAQFAAVDGTAVNLSDATNGINATVTNCLEVIVQADYDNSGYIMVGGSGVLADTKGVRLNAGDTIVIPVSTTDSVYIRGSAASQNVNVSVIRE
jgi:hypothetical protein